MDRGAWWAAVHGVAKSRTRLNDKHTKSRQEHWSGLPFPSAGDLPNPGIKPRSPALQEVLYHCATWKVAYKKSTYKRKSPKKWKMKYLTRHSSFQREGHSLISSRTTEIHQETT